MPAQIAPASPGVSAPKYSIIGKYIDGPNQTFVQHVALAREEGPAVYGVETPVWGMEPPLVAGQNTAARTRNLTSCRAHLVGWVSLEADESEGITDWLAEIDKQDRPADRRSYPEQYTVSMREDDAWHKDERGVRLYRRFSCVSFVLAAYLEGANIKLIDTSNPEQIPVVDLDTVVEAYGPPVRTREPIRTKIGLAGAGPWRVLLPGYVYHALARPDQVIRGTPYVVSSISAARFPMPLAASARAPDAG